MKMVGLIGRMNGGWLDEPKRSYTWWWEEGNRYGIDVISTMVSTCCHRNQPVVDHYPHSTVDDVNVVGVESVEWVYSINFGCFDFAHLLILSPMSMTRRKLVFQFSSLPLVHPFHTWWMLLVLDSIRLTARNPFVWKQDQLARDAVYWDPEPQPIVHNGEEVPARYLGCLPASNVYNSPGCLVKFLGLAEDFGCVIRFPVLVLDCCFRPRTMMR